MKNTIQKSTMALLLVLATIFSNCTKEDTTPTCITCIATGVDEQFFEEEVCSDEEEQAFRLEHEGQNVSCQ